MKTARKKAEAPRRFVVRLLAQVEHIPGVAQAAQLLEQTATIGSPGHRVTVTIAGAGGGLALMDGLAHTLPGSVLSAGGISLSKTSANELGITALNSQAPTEVTLDLRGRATRLAVSAVLGHETAGALSLAQVAIMPLATLQRLTGLPHRVTRILIQSQPGHEATVRARLEALAGGRLTVATADQEVSLLRQALRPSSQASALFAGLAGLLGFLFAFNAILLTTPERRAAITDLRLDGTKRSAIIQMVLFQALCLGVAASLLGLLAGYALALGVFQTSPGYLSQAFTLGGNTVIGTRPVVLSLAGGILATCLASAVPLQDLRRGRRLDAVYAETSERDQTAGHNTQRHLFIVAVGLVAIASVLFVFVPSAAIIACVLLALATILAVPVVLSAVLRAAEMLAMSNDRLTTLPLAIGSLRARTFRSLALTATGAVALFGSVALSGAQHDLLRGLHNFARAYATDGQVWVVNPGYIPETTSFLPDQYASRIARIPGVTGIHLLQSEFMNMTNRRVVIVARPPDTGQEVLRTQILDGNLSNAHERLREGGWVAVSKQYRRRTTRSHRTNAKTAHSNRPILVPGCGTDNKLWVAGRSHPHEHHRLQSPMGDTRTECARHRFRTRHEHRTGAIRNRHVTRRQQRPGSNHRGQHGASGSIPSLAKGWGSSETYRRYSYSPPSLRWPPRLGRASGSDGPRWPTTPRWRTPKPTPAHPPNGSHAHALRRVPNRRSSRTSTASS